MDLLELVDPTLLGSRPPLRSGLLSVRALAKLLKGSYIHTYGHRLTVQVLILILTLKQRT